MTTIQTIEDWMNEAERIRRQYVNECQKLRRKLGRLVDESKAENLWADPTEDES